MSKTIEKQMEEGKKEAKEIFVGHYPKDLFPDLKDGETDLADDTIKAKHSGMVARALGNAVASVCGDVLEEKLEERDRIAYERGREFERERIESAYEKYCNHDIDLEEFEQTLTNQ